MHLRNRLIGLLQGKDAQSRTSQQHHRKQHQYAQQARPYRDLIHVASKFRHF